MNWLKQTFAIMVVNLQTIPSRLGSSVVAIIGIAGVVIVFVSVLSISAGFSAAMTGSGSPNRALVMRTGVDSELTSNIEGPQIRIIREAPGVRREGDAALATADLYVIVDLPKKASPESPANVPIRGIEPLGLKVRDEVSITEGRPFRFGTNEVIVGKGANNQFVGLNVGDTVISGQNQWVV
ncbi:MAG TPA: ABC transporter permease, partial [Terriglobia bacterium]|nr:ABC transporter permease [Terriglobia bacterium]